MPSIVMFLVCMTENQPDMAIYIKLANMFCLDNNGAESGPDGFDLYNWAQPQDLIPTQTQTLTLTLTLKSDPLP